MARTEEETERLNQIKEQQDARNNERLERLNAIADAADEGKRERDELDDPETWEDRPDGTPPHEGGTSDEVVAEAELADREHDEARDAGADDMRVTNGETYYRLVVNGKEKWLTLPQLRAKASKVESGDEYLQVAKEAATNIVRPVPSQDVPADDQEEIIAGMLERVTMGEQKAIGELARTLATILKKDVDLSKVHGLVDGRIAFNEAYKEFEREYKDVITKNNMWPFCQQVDAQLQSQNPSMDTRARLKMVGEIAKKEFRRRQQEYGVINPERSEKELRKAQVRTPPAAAGRPPEVEDDDGEEAISDVISKIAEQRGSRAIIHRR